LINLKQAKPRRLRQPAQNQTRGIFRVGRRFDRNGTQPAGEKNDRQFSLRIPWFRDDAAQAFAVRHCHRVVDNVDVRITLARRFRFPRKLLCRNRGGKPKQYDCRPQLHLPFAALTTFCAASARSSAAISARPLSFNSCLPRSTFVPSKRTTSGTDNFTVFAAAMMPCAITSHFMMPPKIFTRIAFTFLSAIRILNASVTCSSVAPPP